MASMCSSWDMRSFGSEMLFHGNKFLRRRDGQQDFQTEATKLVRPSPPMLNDISNAFKVLHVKHFLGLARWEFHTFIETNPQPRDRHSLLPTAPIDKTQAYAMGFSRLNQTTLSPIGLP